jgi:CheY-like chemotaxis protein
MSEAKHIQPADPAAPLILIVDDEFDVASAYAMLFEYHGFRVRTAANGQLALEAAEQETPAIVLSDLMMPVMDGAELCLRWRAHPELAHVPFILASAGMVHQEGTLPYDVFFKKPVRFDVLLAEIRRLTGTDKPRA